MISFVLFSIRRAWQGFWRNAVMSLAATATMVLMLLLLAGFWIIQTGLLAGLQFTEQKVEVVADLQTNATENQIDDAPGQAACDARGRRRSPTSAGTRRSSASARRCRRRAARTSPATSTPTRCTPASRSSWSTRRACASSATPSRADPSVRNVINIEDLVERVLTVTNLLRTAGTVLLVIVGVIALFIIINTIRLAVLARAEEIEVMRLVGASDAFIRWPFVFEGAFVGLLASLATLAILAAVADPLSAFMVDFFRVLPLQFGSLTRDLVALVMGAGIGLGILGSWLSVRTYLIR